jgi:hypothetical protein
MIFQDLKERKKQSYQNVSAKKRNTLKILKYCSLFFFGGGGVGEVVSLSRYFVRVVFANCGKRVMNVFGEGGR